MMYNIVAQELKSIDLKDSHPQDYLNFYCLGNREEPQKDINQSTNQPPQNGDKVHESFRLVFESLLQVGALQLIQLRGPLLRILFALTIDSFMYKFDCLETP